MSKTKITKDQEKLIMLKQMITNAEKNITAAHQLLNQLVPQDASSATKTRMTSIELDAQDGNIIEGAFDGEAMLGSDGKQYPVPANYASKSKLIEGDTMKLTILPDGSFIYKQIGPAEREKIRGVLTESEQGDFTVFADGKTYKVLLASVTYFKGMSGDSVTLIVPEGRNSEWGAIENIIKDLEGTTPEETETQLSEEPSDKEAKEETPNIEELEKELNVSGNLL